LLRAGDCLFSYTDGLFENHAPDGTMIDERSVLKLFSVENTLKDIDDGVHSLMKEIWRDYDLQDDMSYIILKWSPRASSGAVVSSQT
jgi:serine phosphatase RsbU (regulator of sigma subunit)